MDSQLTAHAQLLESLQALEKDISYWEHERLNPLNAKQRQIAQHNLKRLYLLYARLVPYLDNPERLH